MMKSMLGLCFSAFLMMLGVGMIVALLPQRVLSLTGQASTVAYLTSAFAFSYVLLQVPYGNLSDRLGFKPFLVFGYLLCVLAGVLYYFAPSVNLILLGRLLQGAGEAPVWSLAPALLSIHYPAARGKVLGIYNASIHLGLTLGPLLGILLADTSNAFLIYGAVCLIGCLILYLGVEHAASVEYTVEKISFRNVLSIVTRRDSLPVLIGITLYGGGYASFLTIVPVFLLNERGFLPAAVGLHFALFYIAISLSQFVVGPLSDRVGRTGFMVIGFGIAALAMMLLPSLPHAWILVILASASLGLGTFHVTSMALLNDRASDEQKGTISGAYYLFWGLGYFGGPLILASLSESFGFNTGFYFLSLLLLMVMLVIFTTAK